MSEQNNPCHINDLKAQKLSNEKTYRGKSKRFANSAQNKISPVWHILPRIRWFYQELKSPKPVLALCFLAGASLVEGLSPSGWECFLMKESELDIKVN